MDNALKEYLNILESRKKEFQKKIGEWEVEAREWSGIDTAKEEFARNEAYVWQMKLVTIENAIYKFKTIVLSQT